jgi:hypothetical protein
MTNGDFGAVPLTAIAEDLAEPAAPESERRVYPDNLAEHIYNTYWWLRFGLGCLGFVFPLVVVFCHRPDPLKVIPGATDLLGRDLLRGSLSAYYDSHQVGHFLIGELFAVGMCLIFYRGFTRKEDAVLNAAGIFAIGVSLIPYDSGIGEFAVHPSGFGSAIITAHGACAILHLMALGYVAWFRSSDTLYGYKIPAEVRRYKFLYRFFAAMMVAGVLVAGVLRSVELYRPFTTLIAEVIGTWGFAGYWLLKSFEIRRRFNQERLKAGAGTLAAMQQPA